MVRGVWIGILTPEKHTDHRTQQMGIDISIKYLYAFKRTINTIENLCVIVVGSIPRERSTSPMLLVARSRSSDLSLLLFSLPSSLRTSDFQDFEHRIANHSSGTVQDSHLLPLH